MMKCGQAILFCFVVFVFLWSHSCQWNAFQFVQYIGIHVHGSRKVSEKRQRSLHSVVCFFLCIVVSSNCLCVNAKGFKRFLTDVRFYCWSLQRRGFLIDWGYPVNIRWGFAPQATLSCNFQLTLALQISLSLHRFRAWKAVVFEIHEWMTHRQDDYCNLSRMRA